MVFELALLKLFEIIAAQDHVLDQLCDFLVEFDHVGLSVHEVLDGLPVLEKKVVVGLLRATSETIYQLTKHLWGRKRLNLWLLDPEDIRVKIKPDLVEALDHFLFNLLYSYLLVWGIMRLFHLVLYSTTFEGVVLRISRWPRICGMLVFISNIGVLTGMCTNWRIVKHLTGFGLILEFLLAVWLKVRALPLLIRPPRWGLATLIRHRLCAWCLGLIFLPHIFDGNILIDLKVTFVVWPMLSLKIGVRCWGDVICGSFSWSAVIRHRVALLVLLIIWWWSAATIRALLLTLVPSLRILVPRLLGVTSCSTSTIAFLMFFMILIIFLVLRWLNNLWFFLMLEHSNWHIISHIHLIFVCSIDIQDVIWEVIDLLWLIVVAVVIHWFRLFWLRYHVLILVWHFNLCVQDVLIKRQLVVIKIIDHVGKFSSTLMMQYSWTTSLITAWFKGGVWSFLGQ